MKNWKSMPVLALYMRDTVMLQFNYLTRAKQGLGKQERDHRIGRDNVFILFRDTLETYHIFLFFTPPTYT